MINKIVLDSITTNKNVVEYTFYTSETLKKYFNVSKFFIEYDQPVDQVPISILTIPFVSCMAGLSWLTKSMLFVDEIDATFYDAFKCIKSAYGELHQMPSFGGMLVPSIFRKINLEAENDTDSIMLYGGGVDGMSSTIRNANNIKYLCNIYGWLKSLDESNNVDEGDKSNTASFAKLMGIDSLHVRSNFASMFNMRQIDADFSSLVHAGYWYGFLHPMAFISITIPLAFSKGISRIIIASSFTKDRADVHCASFVTTDSQFRFAGSGHILHDAFELNRQDKVGLIVKYHKETGKTMYIQACSFNDHNCCECEKCFRTIAEIIGEGEDPSDYGFTIEGSVTEHFKKVLKRDLSQWAPDHEDYYYYYSRKKIKDNYDQIKDKEFADWFLNFDFMRGKKKALRRYYLTNFFSIIAHKFRGLLK